MSPPPKELSGQWRRRAFEQALNAVTCGERTHSDRRQNQRRLVRLVWGAAEQRARGGDFGGGPDSRKRLLGMKSA